MKAKELIELLEAMPEDATVRLAIQPEYPMEHTIDNVVLANGVVYISELRQRGYLPDEAVAELGW